MELFNLHTHTHFCDGQATPEAFVMKAIDKNFSKLGFSSHAPLHFRYGFEMNFKNIGKYIGAIQEVKEQYKERLEIFLSLEADYIEGLTEPFENFKTDYALDYIIGAIHLVKNKNREEFWFIEGRDSLHYDEGLARAFDNDARQAVGSYYVQLREMMETQKPDIVAHMDKVAMHNRERFFSTADAWYQQEVEETLEVIKSSGAILEVNTRAKYKGKSVHLSPETNILKRVKEKGIPVTISTDAHRPEELDLLWMDTAIMLREIGFEEIYTFGADGFFALPLTV